MSDHGASSDSCGSAWCAEGSDESEFWNESSDYESLSEDNDVSKHGAQLNNSPAATKECCDKKCKATRQKEIDDFLASVSLMTKREKQTCMTTCLSLLWNPKRQMRHVYKDDCNKASGSHVVLTMDFSQNLALPNAASTPGHIRGAKSQF
ncbi:hypothetical protein AeRB84_021402 [Aphanomyces euteiches]|nr:hypothetical protein AeRB84_021402 [Aphanomyces euteiches]